MNRYMNCRTPSLAIEQNLLRVRLSVHYPTCLFTSLFLNILVYSPKFFFLLLLWRFFFHRWILSVCKYAALLSVYRAVYGRFVLVLFHFSSFLYLSGFFLHRWIKIRECFTFRQLDLNRERTCTNCPWKRGTEYWGINSTSIRPL